MKNIKKLLALVLALAICAAFALPALATADEAGKPASEGPFTLTMNTPQQGHMYEIYQLFKGNPAKDGENWILANVEYGSSKWQDGELPAAEAAEKISKFTTQELNEFVAGLDYENMTAVDNSLKNADDATTPLIRCGLGGLGRNVSGANNSHHDTRHNVLRAFYKLCGILNHIVAAFKLPDKRSCRVIRIF